jgi:hypothetical protein
MAGDLLFDSSGDPTFTLGSGDALTPVDNGGGTLGPLYNDPTVVNQGGIGGIVDTSQASATTPVIPAAGAGGSSILSGLAGMFEATGAAVGAVYNKVNPTVAPKVYSLPGQTGGYVYNAATGQYVPAVPSTASTLFSGTSGVVLLLGIGVLLVILLKVK